MRNTKRRSVSQRIANNVFKHHGFYSVESRIKEDVLTEEVVLAPRPVIDSKIGRFGAMIVAAIPGVYYGINAITQRYTETGQISGALSLPCLAGVAFIAYEDLVAANRTLPDSVGPRVDGQALAAADAQLPLATA